MSNMSKKDAVWNKAKEIPNRNPAHYRKDPYGNVMKYSDYGKQTDSAWDIDHIKPKARGGSDDIRNLQALNSKVNRQKGDSQVKRSRHSKGNK